MYVGFESETVVSAKKSFVLFYYSLVLVTDAPSSL